LGGLSYYRRFLKNMAKRVRPLTALLKKGVPFVFTSEMEAIVRDLLAELAKPPILVFPDWKAVEDGSRPLLLCCDASTDGLGATLEQKQPDGTIKPIVFISRATLDAERNWTPLDLEAGAIVWAIKRLREYLRGTKFCILSDNSALQNMSKISEHNPRVQRCVPHSCHRSLVPRALPCRCWFGWARTPLPKLGFGWATPFPSTPTCFWWFAPLWCRFLRFSQTRAPNEDWRPWRSPGSIRCPCFPLRHHPRPLTARWWPSASSWSCVWPSVCVCRLYFCCAVAAAPFPPVFFCPFSCGHPCASCFARRWRLRSSCRFRRSLSGPPSLVSGSSGRRRRRSFFGGWPRLAAATFDFSAAPDSPWPVGSDFYPHPPS